MKKPFPFLRCGVLLLAGACMGMPALLGAGDGAAAAPAAKPRPLPVQLDLAAVRTLAVQQDGRKKPLDTVAREVIYGLTGRSIFGSTYFVDAASGVRPDPVILLLALWWGRLNSPFISVCLHCPERTTGRSERYILIPKPSHRPVNFFRETNWILCSIMIRRVPQECWRRKGQKDQPPLRVNFVLSSTTLKLSRKI